MKICKSCERPMKDEDGICTFCGYNPKTDTISPTFKQVIDPVRNPKDRRLSGGNSGIDPRVKVFAFIGLAVIAFSILYKNNFRIIGVGSEMRYFFTRLKTGKLTSAIFGRKENKADKKVELIDMGSFQAPQDAMERKDLVVEGISFNPDSRSFVVINGRVISEGESFGSITVKKINRDSVEMVIDGQSRIVRIHQSIK